MDIKIDELLDRCKDINEHEPVVSDLASSTSCHTRHRATALTLRDDRGQETGSLIVQLMNHWRATSADRATIDNASHGSHDSHDIDWGPSTLSPTSEPGRKPIEDTPADDRVREIGLPVVQPVDPTALADRPIVNTSIHDLDQKPPTSPPLPEPVRTAVEVEDTHHDDEGQEISSPVVQPVRAENGTVDSVSHGFASGLPPSPPTSERIQELVEAPLRDGEGQETESFVDQPVRHPTRAHDASISTASVSHDVEREPPPLPSIPEVDRNIVEGTLPDDHVQEKEFPAVQPLDPTDRAVIDTASDDHERAPPASLPIPEPVRNAVESTLLDDDGQETGSVVVAIVVQPVDPAAQADKATLDGASHDFDFGLTSPPIPGPVQNVPQDSCDGTLDSIKQAINNAKIAANVTDKMTEVRTVLSS